MRFACKLSLWTGVDARCVSGRLLFADMVVLLQSPSSRQCFHCWADEAELEKMFVEKNEIKIIFYKTCVLLLYTDYKQLKELVAVAYLLTIIMNETSKASVNGNKKNTFLLH